jgi:hypothetical protein
MRKILSALLAFILVLTLLPVDTYAAQVSESKSIIELDDGSYIEIRVEETAVRATNTKNGSKTYSYYDSNDNLEWTAKLSASFTYNGTTSSCTSGSCAVTIYESNWYEYSNTTTRSGSTATTALVMGRKFLGVTVSKPEYTITLTCDKDGNLS